MRYLYRSPATRLLAATGSSGPVPPAATPPTGFGERGAKTHTCPTYPEGKQEVKDGL